MLPDQIKRGSIIRIPIRGKVRPRMAISCVSGDRVNITRFRTDRVFRPDVSFSISREQVLQAGVFLGTLKPAFYRVKCSQSIPA